MNKNLEDKLLGRLDSEDRAAKVLLPLLAVMCGYALGSIAFAGFLVVAFIG